MLGLPYIFMREIVFALQCHKLGLNCVIKQHTVITFVTAQLLCFIGTVGLWTRVILQPRVGSNKNQSWYIS